MRRTLPLLILPWTFAVHALALAAEEDVYVPAPPGYVTSEEASFVVPNMPPIKDQNGVGLCYAFSTATLAEHYICKSKGSQCNGADDLISPVALSEYNENRREVQNGGYPESILSELAKGPKLRKEKCAPFPPLAGFVKRFGGWDSFQEKFTQYKAREGCPSCLETEMKNYFPAHFTALASALKAATFEAFLWEVFVPESCKTEQSVQMPQAKKQSYFINGRSQKERSTAADRIEQLLLNKVPIVTTLCTARSNETCTEAHGTVVSGIREICDQDDVCLLQFKVHNSYGTGWQEKTAGGWVLADNYLDHVESFHWLESPGQTLLSKRLPRSGSKGRSIVVTPVDLSRKPFSRKPGDDIGKFLADCRKRGGTPSFSDSGTRCEFY